MSLLHLRPQYRLGDEVKRLMHLVPAPAVRLIPQPLEKQFSIEAVVSLTLLVLPLRVLFHEGVSDKRLLIMIEERLGPHLHGSYPQGRNQLPTKLNEI